MNILDEIIAHKRKEVASAELLIPESELHQMAGFKRKTLSLKEYLQKPDKSGIIAEYKRKSPSKGIINNRNTVEEVTTGYANAGASALSILTDFNFFGGSVDDLILGRKFNSIPILRKEFIINEYQIIEARAVGADAILLIAAVLSADECKTLALKAHELDLEVLLELHDENELDHIHENIDVVGVNNRNLKTFEVNLRHSVDMAKKIPSGFLKISESGIQSAEDIRYLKENGFEGFLIGENFMKQQNPSGAFAQFVSELQNIHVR